MGTLLGLYADGRIEFATRNDIPHNAEMCAVVAASIPAELGITVTWTPQDVDRRNPGRDEISAEADGALSVRYVDPPPKTKAQIDAKRAAQVLEQAIRLEARSRDLASLAAKGMPGAAEALAAVEVEQVALIGAAKARV